MFPLEKIFVLFLMDRKWLIIFYFNLNLIIIKLIITRTYQCFTVTWAIMHCEWIHCRLHCEVATSRSQMSGWRRTPRGCGHLGHAIWSRPRLQPPDAWSAQPWMLGLSTWVLSKPSACVGQTKRPRGVWAASKPNYP
jgi:hypothetical protein